MALSGDTKLVRMDAMKDDIDDAKQVISASGLNPSSAFVASYCNDEKNLEKSKADPEKSNKHHQDLLKILKEKQILPLKDKLYVHKSKIGHKHSLLILSDDQIYELIHDDETGKKIILGKGKDAVVRDAIDVVTGRHVAIKIHPFYEKKSCPRQFKLNSVPYLLKKWELSQQINKSLPGTFIKLIGFAIAGDKSTQHCPDNRVLYVITDKCNKTLAQFMANEVSTFNDIKAILIKVLQVHRNLILNGYVYADANFCNVLLNDSLEPVFIDPNSLATKEELDDLRIGGIGLFIGLSLSLADFIERRVNPKNMKEAQKDLQNHLQNHLKIFFAKISPVLFDKNISETVIADATNEFFANLDTVKNSNRLVHDKISRQFIDGAKAITNRWIQLDLSKRKKTILDDFNNFRDKYKELAVSDNQVTLNWAKDYFQRNHENPFTTLCEHRRTGCLSIFNPPQTDSIKLFHKFLEHEGITPELKEVMAGGNVVDADKKRHASLNQA